MIFIDTGAFLARYLVRDQHHSAAVDFWDELIHTEVPCFTTNLVLSETLTLLGRRATYRFAAERARHIYASSVLKIVRPDMGDETTALVLLEKYSEHDVTFCDCVSFVVMRRLGIENAFTFDRDFMIAGFNVRP